MDYVLIRLEVLLEDTFAVLAQKKPWHLQAVRNIVPTVGISQGQNPSRKSNQDCLQTVQQQVSTTPSPMPVSSAVGMKASAAKATLPQAATAKPVMAFSQSQEISNPSQPSIFSAAQKPPPLRKNRPRKPSQPQHPVPANLQYQNLIDILCLLINHEFLTTSNQRQHSAQSRRRITSCSSPGWCCRSPRIFSAKAPTAAERGS